MITTRKVNAYVQKVGTDLTKTLMRLNSTKLLKSIPWDAIKYFVHVDNASDVWYSLFSDVIDKHVPLKKHRVIKVNQSNWLTPEIIDSIKTQDHYKAIGNNNQNMEK